jgi:hypothetical protein
MKFMKQVGDGDVNLEDGRLTEEEAQLWSKEFLQEDKEKVETAAKKLEKNYGKQNIIIEIFYLPVIKITPITLPVYNKNKNNFN